VIFRFYILFNKLVYSERDSTHDFLLITTSLPSRLIRIRMFVL